MPRVLAALALAALGAPLGAAEPDKVDLWHADSGGYRLYRIPGVVVTKAGTVLAYCEARKSDRSDWGTIDILLKRSTDGGKTWGDAQTVADVPGPKERSPVALAKKLGANDDVTYNNPVMIADRGGAVHLVFCLEYMRCFYARSDDGKTWSKPTEITAGAFGPFRKELDWKAIATGPGHGIQLKGGRLVVPVWVALGTGGSGHGDSVSATIFSDDGGKTWGAGAVAIPNTAEWTSPNECAVAELPDGTVMLNARSPSKANRRLVTVSPDGATKWSKPTFDDALVEPVCMGSLLAVPGAKPRLLFSNPDNLEKAGAKAPAAGASRDRKNVTVRTSDDGGKTWGAKQVVESGPSAYSDLAVLPDGTILVFYERAGEKGGSAYGRLTLARLR